MSPQCGPGTATPITALPSGAALDNATGASGHDTDGQLDR
jgi:hypothetical protein